jgi:phosphoribosylformylglycinamidine (FGAM) synthase PurS component
VYLIENIPFGQVTVKVPHNVRDPEAYAVGRARQLIGVNEPEHIDVTDFNQWENSTPSLRDEVYVELHFNGFYEA